MALAQPSNFPGAPGAGAATSYPEAVRAAAGDPPALERLYEGARRAREGARFAEAIAAAYREAPDNLLYAAWYHRLQPPARGEGQRLPGGAWRWAVPVGLVLALALWLLSDPGLTLQANVPYLALLLAPLVAVAILVVLAAGGGRHPWRSAALALLLAGVAAYALVVAQGQSAYQLAVVALHLPLLAAGAIGLALVGWRSSAASRFAFLTKAIEAIGAGGVYGIAGGIFVGITVGLFAALDITLSNVWLRLLAACVAGLLPLLAIASVYDPASEPTEQEFGSGFGRILAVLMRALLALGLIVLVVYAVVIPFNFAQPFQRRDVLIVYNVLLFGIVALLVGVTPMTTDDLAPRARDWLRGGIVAVAALVALISLYALAATVYRTAEFGLSLNRATVIGWNVINIGILLLLLLRQSRAGRAGWVAAAQAALGLGAYAYLIWAAVVALALPWFLAG